MNEQTGANSFLEMEKLGTLMRRYSIPCIISLLVAALYNIVDQIFIATPIISALTAMRQTRWYFH